MAGEFVELFEELLFGVESGGILVGFGVLVSLAFLVTWKVKFSGLPWAVVLFYLGIKYTEEISVSSSYMWFAVLSFMCVIVLVVKVAWDAKGLV